MTVDFEEWFQVYYLEKLAGTDQWPGLESKADRMLDSLLDMFEENGVKATFFFVGWLAHHRPELIRRARKAGHEIASHGYWHREVSSQGEKEFKDDLVASKKALEDAVGEAVDGYRAPGFSITPRMGYALDAVQEAGFRYDSSVLAGTCAPYEIRKGLLEIPPNALTVLTKRLPINGGFVFRALPYVVYRWYVNALERRGERLNFYTHSWEIRDDYPRMALPWMKRFVQYFNLSAVPRKFDRLMKDFKFTSIQSAFSHHLSGSRTGRTD